VLLAPILTALTACGGDNPVTGHTQDPSPTPAPPVTSTIAEGSVSGLGPFLITDIPFTTTATGNVEVRVNWQSPSDHIIVYVAKGACSFEHLKSNTCDLVAFSESTTPKPRVLTVAGAGAGHYVLWVGNLGPHSEVVSYHLLLTTGGTSAANRRPSEATAERIGDFVGILER
jgi:hypothetical protein